MKGPYFFMARHDDMDLLRVVVTSRLQYGELACRVLVNGIEVPEPQFGENQSGVFFVPLCDECTNLVDGLVRSFEVSLQAVSASEYDVLAPTFE